MSDIKEKFIEYLEANELEYIDRGQKISHCCINPAHDDQKPSAFTIFRDANVFSHCKGCGYTMADAKFYEFLEIGFDENILLMSTINNMLKVEKKKDEQIIDIFLPIKDGNFEKEYRSISKDTFSKVKAFYTFKEGYYGKRIIIPNYDISGKLRSFEAISTNKEIQPKVLRPKNVVAATFFGFENLINTDTVFICEGVFNALSFIELGYDGIFNFGVGFINEKVRTLHTKGVKNIILCGDNDEAGRKFNGEMFKLLRKDFNVGFFRYYYGFPDKGDTNDLLKEGREVFQNCIDNTLKKMLLKV